MRLRTVVLHRPGPELARLTPRNDDDLLFDGVPWLERAQEEHDQFADVLRAAIAGVFAIESGGGEADGRAGVAVPRPALQR